MQYRGAFQSESRTKEATYPFSNLQRFQPALSHQRLLPTNSRSPMKQRGTSAPRLSPFTLIWRWEEKTFLWASGPVSVLLCCSTSTLSIGSTWHYSSTNTVRTITLFVPFAFCGRWKLSLHLGYVPSGIMENSESCMKCLFERSDYIPSKRFESAFEHFLRRKCLILIDWLHYVSLVFAFIYLICTNQ